MKNKNFFRRPFIAPLHEDKTVKVLSVDQFPCSNKGIMKDDGFPMTDIGILDRFSQDMQFDDDFIKMVANRLEPISETASNLTLEQEIKALRPSWVQTPSEYASYTERVYQQLQNTNTSDDVKEAVKEQVANVEPVTPVSNENS